MEVWVKHRQVILVMLAFVLLIAPVSAVHNLSNDFYVDYSDTVYFANSEDREYFKIRLNETNSSKPFNCISYVADNSTEKYIIQTNPTYTQKSETTLKLFNKRYEDREYFLVENKIGKVYFTKENLVIDGREYIFGVECANEDGRFTAEKLVEVRYQSPHNVRTRMIWINNNMFGLMMVLFIILILIMVVAVLIHSWKK